MPTTFPDLWQVGEDANRLYHLYLSELQRNGQYERVIVACRQIRRFALRGPGLKAGQFTFTMEFDAQFHLRNYKAAFAVLRRREGALFGRKLDLESRHWTADDAMELKFTYAPILYFLRRDLLGCTLMETALDFWQPPFMNSYDLLYYIENNDPEPQHYACVTLAHFYRRLGRDLRHWRHWKAFINGFHSKLFRLAEIKKELLLADATKLAPFVRRLTRIRNQRTLSGVTRGEADLIEPPSKVMRAQAALKRKRDRFNRHIQPKTINHKEKLKQLFPELP